MASENVAIVDDEHFWMNAVLHLLRCDMKVEDCRFCQAIQKRAEQNVSKKARGDGEQAEGEVS